MLRAFVGSLNAIILWRVYATHGALAALGVFGLELLGMGAGHVSLLIVRALRRARGAAKERL